MENELWRRIPDYPNYEASSLGRIRSINGEYSRPGRILKQSRNAKRREDQGYPCVSIWKNKIRKTINVHRLILAAFLGPSKLDCNHKNGIKADNRLENLEYVSRKENLVHALRLGLRMAPRGENQWKAKLTEADVKYIRLNFKWIIPGRLSNSKELAEKFGVSRTTIEWIRLRRTWRHVE